MALPSHLLQTRQWEGPLCRVRLDNTGADAISVGCWVLFDGKLGLPVESAIYGEGFQMLAQTIGSWQSPQPVGRCRPCCSNRGTICNLGTLLLYSSRRENLMGKSKHKISNWPP